ncbi:MAG: recombinase [Marinilabiliales bacterium]|nr:MAG: recombinase [Marinilabiliales bacterium]
MEKRNTFSVHYFLKKHRAKNNNEMPVYLRITVNGERTDMSMHVDVAQNYWNSNIGCATGNSKKTKELNSLLESTRSTIYEKYKYLRETGKSVTAKSVKNAFLGIVPEEEKGMKLIELFEEHNARFEQLVGIDYSATTLKRYKTTLKHTQTFIKQKYGTKDLYLSDLDHKFVTDFEFYFKTTCNCSQNSTSKYIQNLKKIINLALANGYLTSNPFAGYKVRYKKVDRGFLTDEELNKIINLKLSIKRLEQVRDCFVFSCFTGLSHSDIQKLNHDHIVIGTDGGKWIKIKRKKTEVLSSIPILNAAQKILDKYKDNSYCNEKGVLLPVNSNQKMNAYLKEIADLCGIEKKLTSHLARHTFATTVTLNNNVQIETVSKMLGHSSISMTKIYARLLDKKVGKDMQHLNGKFDVEV